MEQSLTLALMQCIVPAIPCCQRLYQYTAPGITENISLHQSISIKVKYRGVLYYYPRGRV